MERVRLRDLSREGRGTFVKQPKCVMEAKGAPGEQGALFIASAVSDDLILPS
jgi:hypothetical protein